MIEILCFLFDKQDEEMLNHSSLIWPGIDQIHP